MGADGGINVSFSASELLEEESKISNSNWYNNRDLYKKASRLRNLSLIDCDIKGLSNLLNQVGRNRLQQLIIIFNNELEQYDEEEGGSIYE